VLGREFRLSRYAVYLLVIPGGIFLALFFLAPLSYIFIVSFYEYVGLKPGYIGGMKPGFVLDNYIQFFSEPVFLNYLWITIRIALICMALTLLIAYPVAYLIARARIGRWVLALVMVSFLIHPLVRVYAWEIVLSEFGPVNTILSMLNLPKINLIGTEPAIVLGLLHFLIPYAVLTLIGPIRRVDPSIEEAAMSLGASPLTTFFKVTLPLTSPGLVAAALLTYSLGVTAFVTPLILGAGKIVVLTMLIFDRFTETVNYPFGAAMVVILLIIGLVAVVLIDYLFKVIYRRRPVWTAG